MNEKCPLTSLLIQSFELLAEEPEHPEYKSLVDDLELLGRDPDITVYKRLS